MRDLTPGVPTIAVPCPVCYSGPNERCTAPDDRGQHPVTTLHGARVPREFYPARYAFGKPDAFEGFGAAL